MVPRWVKHDNGPTGGGTDGAQPWYERPVSRFWAGFGVASLIWGGGAAFAVLGLGYGPAPAESPEPAVAAEPLDAGVMAEEEPRRRPRRSRRGGETRAEATPTGEATTGDDLGEDEVRTLDMGASGGEQQLSSSQIEAAFDGGMGRIRRCLVLMAGEDEVTGRLTFGLRVAGDGQVRAVSLSGPRAATTGDAGECLRGAARALRFPSFDGPEMVVRYPLTLE